ncbi:hypothetical protein F5880DRAFT_1512789, partial [Lentinula raphanica]
IARRCVAQLAVAAWTSYNTKPYISHFNGTLGCCLFQIFYFQVPSQINTFRRALCTSETQAPSAQVNTYHLLHLRPSTPPNPPDDRVKDRARMIYGNAIDWDAIDLMVYAEDPDESEGLVAVSTPSSLAMGWKVKTKMAKGRH